MLPISQSDALIFFSELTAVRPYYTDLDEPMVINLLENSKAPGEAGVVYYRPYWVAAYFLTQVPRLHELSKAEDGVTFTGLAIPIRSLFSIQQAKDLQMGLQVPPGMEADPCAPRCGGNGNSGGGNSPSARLPLFGTFSMSVPVRVGGFQ